MNPSEENYRSIVENLNELICRCLPDGSLTYANRAFCQHFSLSIPHIRERSCLELYPENRKASLLINIAALRPHNAAISTSHFYTDDQGKSSWQYWTDYGFFDEEGKLAEIISVGQQFTEQKLVDVAAVQYARELSALHAATSALLTTLDLEKLLGQILDAATSAIPAAEKGMLHLVAHDTGELETRALLGYTETDNRIQQYSRPSHADFVIKAVKNRKPQIIHDIQKRISATADNSSDGKDIHSVIVAPLILNERVLGVLSLQSSDRSAFTEADLRLLVSFAATATAAIRNAQLHAEVRSLANTDSLTGLFNRRGFEELAKREVDRAQRFKRPLSVLMMDIDRFKYINDTYGHSIGDAALRTMAEQCRNNTRKVDILGRYGGDEFVIMLPENDLFAAENVAERIRKVLASTPIAADQRLIFLTVSIGVVSVSQDISSLDQLMTRADLALYTAKQSGKNQVHTT